MDCTILEDMTRRGAVIHLSGAVNDELVTSFRKQQKEFYASKERSPEAAVVLTTTGGSIVTGIALYNAIDSFRKGGVDKLWLIALGTVRSMGVHLLPAQPDPKMRFVYPGTTLYHHLGTITREVKISGDVARHVYDIAEHQALVNASAQEDIFLQQLLATATGRTLEELKELESSPKYLTAEEAVERGFYGGLMT